MTSAEAYTIAVDGHGLPPTFLTHLRMLLWEHDGPVPVNVVVNGELGPRTVRLGPDTHVEPSPELDRAVMELIEAQSLPSILNAFKANPACRNCLGTGHVCEAHPWRPWGGIHDGGCQCGAAGQPCGCG